MESNSPNNFAIRDIWTPLKSRCCVRAGWQAVQLERIPANFISFGNKETTIKRLRTGTTNKSDADGVLQSYNIHIAVCPIGGTTRKLEELKSSPATKKAKAKFAVATDGDFFEAEDIGTGETLACNYKDFPNHFGFFLSLAGISTVQQIRESSFNANDWTTQKHRAFKRESSWGRSDKRHEINNYMARLIFVFAEDTGIFIKPGLFTQMQIEECQTTCRRTHTKSRNILCHGHNNYWAKIQIMCNMGK